MCVRVDPWGARLCPPGVATSRRRCPLPPSAGPAALCSETLPRCSQYHRDGSVRVSRELQVRKAQTSFKVHSVFVRCRRNVDVSTLRCSLLYTKVKLESMCRGPEEALLTCKHMLQIWKSFYNLTNPRYPLTTTFYTYSFSHEASFTSRKSKVELSKLEVKTSFESLIPHKQ